MCILGEPTEAKVVLGHFGVALAADLDARQLHPHRLQRGQARPELDPAHARGARRRARVDPRPGRTTRRTPTAARRRSSTSARSRGGFGWRVSRTPHRTDLFLDVRVPPTKPMGGRPRARCSTWCAGSPSASPTTAIEGEVYVTAPGAEIDEGHPLIAAIDAAHEQVFGEAPERDVTRWFSRRLGAHALRHPDASTTAPRPACWTRPTARTSTSTGSSRRPQVYALVGA